MGAKFIKYFIFINLFLMTAYIINKELSGVIQKKVTTRFYIARVLSNDLPPLHSENQTLLNTELILNQEKLPSDYRRSWVVHSIVDSKKEKQLSELLNSKHERNTVIQLPKTSNFSVLKKMVFNVNRARSKILVSAFEDGAEWVIISDGCTFLTNESLDALQSFLENRGSLIFMFIPMFRLQHKVRIDMFGFILPGEVWEWTSYNRVFGVSTQFLLQVGLCQRRAQLLFC